MSAGMGADMGADFGYGFEDGYADERAERTDYDRADCLIVPDTGPDDGDYAEGYRAGAEQAKTDRESESGGAS